jgi:hypothetical protein
VFVNDLEVLNEVVPCSWCQQADVREVGLPAPSPTPYPISPTTRATNKWKTCICFGAKVGGGGGDGGAYSLFMRCNQGCFLFLILSR